MKLTYTTNSDGDEEGRDKNGNRIHLKRNDGFEAWYKFDEHGNEIYFKAGYLDDNGNIEDAMEKWLDANGNVIRYKNGGVDRTF